MGTAGAPVQEELTSKSVSTPRSTSRLTTTVARMRIVRGVVFSHVITPRPPMWVPWVRNPNPVPHTSRSGREVFISPYHVVDGTSGPTARAQLASVTDRAETARTARLRGDIDTSLPGVTEAPKRHAL